MRHSLRVRGSFLVVPEGYSTNMSQRWLELTTTHVSTKAESLATSLSGLLCSTSGILFRVFLGNVTVGIG